MNDRVNGAVGDGESHSHPGDAPAASGEGAARESAFVGRVIDVSVERVLLPNGVTAELEIIRHPGGAAVVAINERYEICLLRQYRYAVNGWLWELHAGKIDNREPPLSTAQRELAEEAGVIAEQWRSLGRMVSSPGVFTEVVYLFMASELSLTETATEPEEVIEIHWVPFEEAARRAAAADRDGFAVGEFGDLTEICDAKSVLGILRAAALLGVEL